MQDIYKEDTEEREGDVDGEGKVWVEIIETESEGAEEESES